MNVSQCAIVLAGYVVTILTSGCVVRHFICISGRTIESEQDKGAIKAKYDLGAVIGKCENFLTITLILANAFTGLALIFSAKSIIRREDIQKDPAYYLGGTLVNFSYSVLIGFLIRVLLAVIGHPIPSLPAIP